MPGERQTAPPGSDGSDQPGSVAHPIRSYRLKPALLEGTPQKMQLAASKAEGPAHAMEGFYILSSRMLPFEVPRSISAPPLPSVPSIWFLLKLPCVRTS